MGRLHGPERPGSIQAAWGQHGPKPTAIFCASDEMAMGVIFEANRVGVRVPEDLSVIGIDDHAVRLKKTPMAIRRKHRRCCRLGPAGPTAA